MGVLTQMRFKLKLQNPVSECSGSVMMEYVVITSVFLLGVGGLVYFNGSWGNVFPGLLPDQPHSVMTIDENLNLVPVGEAPDPEIKKYGMAGAAFAEQTRKAQQVVAMPLP